MTNLGISLTLLPTSCRHPYCICTIHSLTAIRMTVSLTSYERLGATAIAMSQRYNRGRQWRERPREQSDTTRASARGDRRSYGGSSFAADPSGYRPARNVGRARHHDQRVQQGHVSRRDNQPSQPLEPANKRQRTGELDVGRNSADREEAPHAAEDRLIPFKLEDDRGIGDDVGGSVENQEKAAMHPEVSISKTYQSPTSDPQAAQSGASTSTDPEPPKAPPISKAEVFFDEYSQTDLEDVDVERLDNISFARQEKLAGQLSRALCRIHSNLFQERFGKGEWDWWGKRWRELAKPGVIFSGAIVDYLYDKNIGPEDPRTCHHALLYINFQTADPMQMS